MMHTMRRRCAVSVILALWTNVKNYSLTLYFLTARCCLIIVTRLPATEMVRPPIVYSRVLEFICVVYYVVVHNDSEILRMLQMFIGECGVDASATLQLRMLRFVNPSGKKSNGDCCDRFIWCYGACDPKFRFALDRGNR